MKTNIIIIDIDYQIDENIKFDLELLKQIVSANINKNIIIEVLIVSNQTIQNLNKEYRGINKATDVLSFPTDFPEIEFEYAPIGSIVISIDFIKKYSQIYKHSLQDEFMLLFIHGFLHLCGYDHEIDNGEHRQKEEEIIKKFNLKQSLIIRTK